MNEEQAYFQVAAEVARGDLKTGLWTKALAESVGNENVAKSLYLKLRAQQVLSERQLVEKRKAKEEFQKSVTAAKDRTVSLLGRGLLLLLTAAFGFLAFTCGLGLVAILLADTGNKVEASGAVAYLLFTLAFSFLAVFCGKGMARS